MLRAFPPALTLSYAGVLYVLEDTPEADAARGTRVDVYEGEDGTISIRSGQTELPARAFQKSGLPRQQSTVVPNKLLDDVIARIRQEQLSETRADLERARTLRERQLLKQRMHRAQEA